MKGIDIVQWAQSKVGFYVDRTWHGGGWVHGPAPIRLAPYHADILRHITETDERGRLRYDTVCIAEPAKSGKSTLAGLLGQFFGLHGETGSEIIFAANTRNQAQSRMYASFTESLQMNPALAIEPGRYECELPTGNVARAIASNSRAAAGARFSLAVFDEPAGFIYDDLERLWSEHKTDPTRSISLRYVTGYAGYLDTSKLWQELLQTGLKGEPVLEHITNGGQPACWANGRHFVFWSHETRQPWQTPEWIDSQRKSLRPAQYARMIECKFVESEGDFVDLQDWLDCIDPTHQVLVPGSREPVHIGLDLATASGGDNCALAGVYFDEDAGKTCLAFHRVWSGKRRERLKLGDSVLPFIVMLAEQFNVQTVHLDRYQGELLADMLWREGISVEFVSQSLQSRSQKDTRLYQMIQDRTLRLYDHPEVRAASLGASAKELPDGRIFLKKANARGKIDLLIALSMCADVVADPVNRGPAVIFI